MLVPPFLRSIPLERELQERLGWFIRLRWLAAGATLLGAGLATALVIPWLVPAPLWGVGLAVAGYNTLFAVFHRRLPALSPGTGRRFAYAQIGLDWVSLSCLVHFTGGIHSPVALAFAFHLIIGAILLSRWACFLQAGAAAMLVGPVSVPAEIYRWLALSSFFAVTAFLATSITARLRQKEEALFAAEQQLERAYAELKALDEERLWLARTTHHQLRAPLAAIQGLLDALLYAGPANEEQRDLVGRARRRVQDMLDMVRDLLDLAGAQRRVGTPAESVPLLACLTEVLETARERAAAKQVRFAAQVSATAAVRAEADDVRRIFSNLLDNALKYTPAGGEVAFRAEERGDRVWAEVSDTGIGIAPADQPRVFQDFYRTQTAKNTGEMGTGLGLSIVRRLVERWGGEVELHSASGQGSRFAVKLPAAPALTDPPTS
ncbi:MAG: HAMP domain-containing histidine kinase [Candidatus Latescibacteria bacterium]|nr:HAMP domain-containing histidine kinase [Candidatus Latescibacterota bacterium]